MKKIQVKIENKPDEYEIMIERGLIDKCGEVFKKYEKVALITDTVVDDLFADRLISALKGFTEVEKFVVDTGEASKSLKVYGDLLKKMSRSGILRNSAVICLGGGVVGDLGAFVASTYMRGIDYFHFPTTLLAMSDSSIGGKNGINLPSGKNLVGTIRQPKAILVDFDLIETLNEDHIVNGVGEIVKHAFYADLSIVNDLMKDKKSEVALIKSMKIKASIIENDVFEAGKRQWLNVGHSIAHALEELSHFQVAHGQAVIVGTFFEAFIALRLSVLTQAEFNSIHEIFEKLELRYLPLERYDLESIWTYMLRDKKNKSKDKVTMSLIDKLGEHVLIHEIIKEDFMRIAEEFYELYM